MATLDQAMDSSSLPTAEDLLGPRPVAEEDALTAANKQADIAEQMKSARKSGDYWAGVEGRIQNEADTVKPFLNPVNYFGGVAANAAALATGNKTPYYLTPGIPTTPYEAVTTPPTSYRFPIAPDIVDVIGRDNLEKAGVPSQVMDIRDGAKDFVGGLVNFMTGTAAGAAGSAMPGMGALAKGATASAFLTDMIRTSPDQVRELVDAYKAGDFKNGTSATANLLMTGLAVLGGGHEALSKKGTYDVQDQSRIQGGEPNQTEGETSQLRGVQEPGAGQEPNPGGGILQGQSKAQLASNDLESRVRSGEIKSGYANDIRASNDLPPHTLGDSNTTPPPIPIEQKLIGRYVNTVGGDPGQIVKANPESFTLKVGNNLYDLPYDNHTPQSLLENSYSYEAEANPAKGGVEGQKPGESPYAFLSRQSQEARNETIPKTSALSNVPPPGNRGRTMPSSFRRVAAEVYPVPGQQPGESANAFLYRQSQETRAKTIPFDRPPLEPGSAAYRGIADQAAATRADTLREANATGVKKKSKSSQNKLR